MDSLFPSVSDHHQNATGLNNSANNSNSSNSNSGGGGGALPPMSTAVRIRRRPNTSIHGQVSLFRTVCRKALPMKEIFLKQICVFFLVILGICKTVQRISIHVKLSFGNFQTAGAVSQKFLRTRRRPFNKTLFWLVLISIKICWNSQECLPMYGPEFRRRRRRRASLPPSLRSVSVVVIVCGRSWNDGSCCCCCCCCCCCWGGKIQKPVFHAHVWFGCPGLVCSGKI